MRIGLQIPRFETPASSSLRASLKNIVQTAEHGGFDSVWVMDHLFQIQMVGPPEWPMLEAYTTLGYLAGLTERVQLGTLVTGVIYRYPGVLAKTITTLDVLAGGRAYLGIGAAWFEHEAKALGVPFPPLKVRFEQLEEALQIVQQMWSDNAGPYRGAHYQLERTLCVPPPVSTPRPPIMIGGAGEQKTLRLVARYGDACNLFEQAGADVLRHKFDVLKRHCDEAGRRYDEIEKTTLGRITADDSARDIVARCKTLAGLGVQHAIFNVAAVETIAPLEMLVRDVIPAIRAF